MYCSVHRPVNTPGVSDNKGSCSQLIKYLSKEIDGTKPFFDSFFSQQEEFVSANAAQIHIDNNHRTLKNNADKFYMLSINPSKDELRCVIKRVTGKDVREFNELSPYEQSEVISELKNYTRKCMDQYAENFYRDKIKDSNDLVWYGRVETERHYKGIDEDVKNRNAKVGDLKPGLNLHIHVVVSRMDRSQTVSLSPFANSKGSKQQINGHSCTIGFNRSEWAERCASTFCNQYNYLPYYIKKKAEYEKWYNEVQLNNMMMRTLKKQALSGQLRNEFKVAYATFRVYRFIVNPRAALVSELKHLAFNLTSGDIL